MKVSLITTVFNEEENITSFLTSIFKQTRLPDEIIIVDGGSTDKTIEKISEYNFSNIKNAPNIKLIFKKGNRSIGRNEAISKARNEIIAITDAGCVLDENWLKNLIKSFSDKKTDVVAGYYKGAAKNVFQKCLTPYVLVMEDKVSDKDFLPATRSMALKKSIWKKADRFDEKLSHNEDYAFANKLKIIGAKIVFCKDAIVNWIPGINFKQAFIMFFRFALGDSEAKIFRDKVVYIFLRYIFLAYLFFLSVIMHSLLLWVLFGFLIIAYIGWSIWKNYKYVEVSKAFIYLPLLQITSDIAVITGTLLGLIRNISLSKFVRFLLNNKGITLLVFSYALVMFLVIDWGSPNLGHPFTYHMDEWHFSQALRTFFKYGSGSISGAASIPLYHIISSVIFLIPFYILKIIDPFAIKYTLDNLQMQHTVFEILRLHTLFYGVLTTVFIYLILKKFIKFFPLLFTALFVISPIWIFLSNYYKYDITLSFWIVLTIFLLIKYKQTQRISNYVYAGIACALALSTKFTALPLFATYIIAYFTFSSKTNLKHLAISIFVVLFIFCFVGIPDMILGKGDYSQLLYSTLIQGPKVNLGYNLGFPAPFFLLFKEFPAMFGYFLISLGYLSFTYWTLVFGRNLLTIKKIGQYKIELYLYLTFAVYIISSVSFGIDGGSNRSLVLLPFIVLLSAGFVKDVSKRFKFDKHIILIAFLIVGIILQLIQTYVWQSVKLSPDPRETSSVWIMNNLVKGSEIGIENIPIYQMLPDVILKEFYLKEKDMQANTQFNYKVIDAKSNALPKIIIITNDFEDVSYFSDSPKKQLVKRLKKDMYNKIIVFTPNIKYFDMFSSDLVFMLVFPTPRTISIWVAP
jgi:glycosyltransferase involved in cell wall biosynthesis